jgi:lysozyme
MTEAISKGDNGARVKQLQRALVALGYSLGKFGVDGWAGAYTLNAARAFCRDHALPEPEWNLTGVPGYVIEIAVALAAIFSHAAPKPERVEGIDVSGWQPALDWREAAEDGIGFAFIKASQGLGGARSFVDHWNGSADAAIPRGPYHFASLIGLRKTQPKEQAANFFGRVKSVGRGLGELPPVLDAEWQNYGRGEAGERARLADLGPNSRLFPASAVVDWIGAFCEEVERLFGRPPIVYTQRSFWRYRMHETNAFDGLPLWLADSEGDGHEIPPGWPDPLGTWQPSIWQFAGSKGVLQDLDGDGLTAYHEGAIDRDLIRGDALVKLKAAA